jgi:hypothetical protein
VTTKNSKTPTGQLDVKAVTVYSLPTTDEIWDVLRRAYGTNLVGATLVAIIDNEGSVTVQTLTYPRY